MHRLVVLVVLAVLGLALVPPPAYAAEAADQLRPVELHLLDLPSPASLTESVAAETDLSRVQKNVELRLKMSRLTASWGWCLWSRCSRRRALGW